MEIAYPFRIDGRGRTADAGRDEHIRQMIEQVLFTSPGERVNRPTFGTGLQQLVFLKVACAEIFCSLEHHVFKHVGNPCFTGCFKGRAGTYGNTRCDLRCCRTFYD